MAILSMTLFACKKEGCTNELASNYDAEATKDNGSCEFDTIPQIGANEFLDERDGEIYRTVEINGVTWMAENLRYQTGNQLAYDNDENNVRDHGYLYTYSDAQTAIPNGWHMATKEEWEALQAFVNNDHTELIVGGSLGLDLRYSGLGNPSGTGFSQMGSSSFFHGYQDQSLAADVSIYDGLADLFVAPDQTPIDYYSLRLIQD